VGIVSLDTETRDEGLQANRGSSWPWRDGHVCGISVARRADGEIRSLYIPMRHPDSDNFDPAQVYRWLKDLIASGVRIVTLNGIYDWGWLRTDGGILMPPSDQLEEIGALATLIDENLFQYSLDALCKHYGLPGKDTALLEEAIKGADFKISKQNPIQCPGAHLADAGALCRSVRRERRYRAALKCLRDSIRFWIRKERATPIGSKST
jgi:hypothetical protein